MISLARDLQHLVPAAGMQAGATAGVSLAPAVRVEGVTKSFGSRSVLAGVGFQVSPGQSVALIGANGAGKSTLIKCLIGLIEPDAGRISVLGQPLCNQSSHSLRKLRSRVGFVWQRHNLVPRASVLTNVLHGAQARQSGPRTWLQSLASHHEREEALRCLAAVGLPDIALQRADRLSGGQSQRVALARVLMQRPEIVLADEPDASLDPQAGNEVMQLLSRMTRDKGLTLVFVSHRLHHALEHADRIIGLGQGRIQFDQPASTVRPDELRRFFAEPHR